MNLLYRYSLGSKKGIPCFKNPEMDQLGWVVHAFLTRQGGVSLSPFHSLNAGLSNGDRKEDVYRNWDLIATAFGFDRDRLVLLKQMQQDEILVLKESIGPFQPFLPYDAMITDASNLFLGIRTADCIPILVVDTQKRVIAAIHSGRQGTGLGITKKVLRRMREEWGCSKENLLITLGPSIGPCCYEVDEKVFLREWEFLSAPNGAGRWRVDLAQINIAQMKEEGIEEEQISWINLCTHCHGDLFFSYRREGQTGRQLSFIGKI